MKAYVRLTQRDLNNKLSPVLGTLSIKRLDARMSNTNLIDLCFEFLKLHKKNFPHYVGFHLIRKGNKVYAYEPEKTK